MIVRVLRFVRVIEVIRVIRVTRVIISCHKGVFKAIRPIQGYH